jgi:hypothetical protein
LSKKIYTGPGAGARAHLAHLYAHFGALPLAGAENDGSPRSGFSDSHTTAGLIALETKSPAAESASDQEHTCGSNYHQRHQLLPIHGLKIRWMRHRATKSLT